MPELNNWLTLKEAAKRLSILIADEVDEARILKFALTGDLRLSVYFRLQTPAKLCHISITELDNYLGACPRI